MSRSNGRTVGYLTKLVHGLLVHVALNRTYVVGVLAGGDHHLVAAAPHPSHGPNVGIGDAAGKGRAPRIGVISD